MAGINYVDKQEYLPRLKFNMKKEKIIIGIDPDLHKSGISVKVNGIYTAITSLPMWDIFAMIKHLNPDMIYLEFSTNKGTWRRNGRSEDVGKNKAVGIIIKEFCEYHKLPLTLINPSNRTGFSQLFDKVEYFKKQTGWTERTNKDARASAAIIFGL